MHGRLELHHCPENRLSGIGPKAVPIEFIDLVAVGKNAVPGVTESIYICNTVALAVYENLASIFVEGGFLPFTNISEMAGVLGNHPIVEIDAVVILAQALIEAFEVPGIGGD